MIILLSIWFMPNSLYGWNAATKVVDRQCWITPQMCIILMSRSKTIISAPISSSIPTWWPIRRSLISVILSPLLLKQKKISLSQLFSLDPLQEGLQDIRIFANIKRTFALISLNTAKCLKKVLTKVTKISLAKVIVTIPRQGQRAAVLSVV